MTEAQYDELLAAVRGHLESLPETCTASNCPQATLKLDSLGFRLRNKPTSTANMLIEFLTAYMKVAYMPFNLF